MDTDKITLTRIVNLIKKLEKEHPEMSKFFRFCVFDDFSGRIEHYNGLDEPVLIAGFTIDNGDTLEDLMQKYGV